MPASALLPRSSTLSIVLPLAPPSPHRQFRRAKAIEHPIERADVNAPVGHGQSAEVIPGRNLIPARPQLRAGLTIQCVEHGMRGLLNAARRSANVSRLRPAL